MSAVRLQGLSVVVPAYNEAGSIASTIERITKLRPSFSFDLEIIVVDDGSTDGTVDIAGPLGARLLRHPSNGGYGRSLLTGIMAAKYDAVAILDADGTYPIESLPTLVSAYEKGFDMVVGARTGRFYHGSPVKRVLRILFRALAEFTCGQRIPDINSGFRVFDRRPVIAWRGALSTGFSFTTTITLLFMLNHLFVGYLPISYEKRTGASKVRLVRDTLRSLQIIVTAIAQFNPLKLYLLLGGLVVFGDLLIWYFSKTLLFQSLLVLAVSWNALALLAGLGIISLALLRPRPAASQA